MSKIGKLPIDIKDGVTVSITDRVVKVSGPKGEEEHIIAKGIKAEVVEDKVIISQVKENDDNTRAMFGLTRALIANIVKGVTDGFEKKLEIIGVGYRAQIQGEDLNLSLGFAHPVRFKPTPGVKLAVKDNVITVSGINKSQVGEMAAKIRSSKPPEPYKGKGIRYAGEVVRKKAGKAAKAVGGK